MTYSYANHPDFLLKVSTLQHKPLDMAQILEKLTNFYFGSDFENCTNFPRKNDLFICQSSRFPFKGEYPPV